MPVGFGTDWTEEITAITNQAAYATATPAGGTDYFTRIREGESNMEWVQIIGEVTVTNKVAGSNEVFTVLTPDGTIPRMTLVGDHSWRYHYEIPTNAIGGKLSFYLKAKEHYTNETDAATWLTRVNDLYTVEQNISEIPFTATLHAPGDLGVGNNLTNISVILDDSSTHLKIEYNDEQRAFSLSHASYQPFNLWTDARSGFRGNVMDGNGVSNSGVSDSKKRYDAPFDNAWEACPQESALWIEKINPDEAAGSGTYPVNKWFSVHKTPNAWTLHNGRFVAGARGTSSSDLAVELDGLGEGALALENLSADKLPLGLGTVNFTARIAQPIQYEDFATYMDGLSCKDYAISAKVTMSREKETETVKPSDMSPVQPSVSFVGYHRGKQGCYEFRMTRKTDTALELALYKWTRAGSVTKPTLLTSKAYDTNLLVPSSTDQASGSYWTSAYFLLYTLVVDGRTCVKLEGHLASTRTQNTINGDGTALANSVISWLDEEPGIFAKGGSYGVGSIDCRAGFGQIGIHDVTRAPTRDADAVINYVGHIEGITKISEEWDFYENRWELDNESRYKADGGLSGVVPSNQVVQVWVADASGSTTSSDEGWVNTGYSVVVNSFTTNMFSVSPRMPGSWNVRLQTGEDEAAGVVLDDVSITPWEGVERWIGNGSTRNGSIYDYSKDWVYTKAWISSAATITHNGKTYELPDDNVISVETGDSDGYAYVFNEAGEYRLTARTDIEIDRVLLVGGGGGGGAAMGGGGGGGGVQEYYWTNTPAVVKSGKTITIKVGAGGAAPVPSGTRSSATSQPAGANGGESSVSGITGKSGLAAKGGGGGGGWSQAGSSGGSGGGGSAQNQNGASGTSGQGYAGGKGSFSGNGTQSTSYGLGGGGGGAGAAGQAGQVDTLVGGNGGDGRSSDITGKVVYYGGGGGGGAGYNSSAVGGAGGAGGGGDGSKYQVDGGATAGEDGLGGGGGGGTYVNNNSDANNKKGRGARGGCGTVILRVRTKSRLCVLQPSRGKDGYPMGLRSPYIDKGMSLFSYSWENADSNCVMLVQIATNMTPADATSHVPRLTESLVTNGTSQAVWTTVARHEFKDLLPSELTNGTRTAFISLRQHWIDDMHDGRVYTNVCGVIRVIVDPAVVSKVANASSVEEREALIDYGKITLTKAYCYNEPELNLRSWFGFNVHTEGWDGEGNAGRFAYLTDWPDGLSIALNFSAKESDNNITTSDTLGIGLGETDPTEVQKYTEQNPFIQCAALTNGIGTVSFRARLFDTNKTSAVITLYGGTDPSADQPTTESQIWKPLTNFVVTSSTYQPFEWSRKSAKNDYKAIRLEAAGARWGRYPAGQAAAWEWADLTDATKYGASVQAPVNRVFIDEVSVSEAIVPRLKFLDVRPFREHLGTEENRVIEDINSMNQQPLIAESWGIQCRVEPQQMSDELDKDSIRVWMEVYRGAEPWGYENWKDLPTYKTVGGKEVQQRFTGELVRVPDAGLVFRSYYTSPESIMPPEETANTVYQYVVRAEFCDKTGTAMDPAVLEAVDWTAPEWYRGSTVGAANASGDASQFSAYTILDAISPRRAWINEVNICDTDVQSMLGRYQFLEFAVPENADLKGWQVKYTAYNLKSGNLFTFGIDDGVRDLTSKIGTRHGVDSTNHYTFVSVCAPSAKGYVPNDGYWKGVSQPSLTDGVFRYYQPYGIQLVRPSGIIEHEIVVQGTNTSMGTFFEYESSGTNLLARLRKSDAGSQWFYAGEDLAMTNTTLGVFTSHGEDSGCWTNYMWDTSTEINRLKDGTLQEIPKGYFLEPFGTNVWIYSTLLRPDLMTQLYGGRDMGANAVIVLPKGTSTNIVLSVTNWYQVGKCTINDVDVPGARGQTGTYVLDFDTVTNSLTVLVDAEPDDRLKDKWGLTENNSYSPAVLAWLMDKYKGYSPKDLSLTSYRNFALENEGSLTLTEMYWLNIPPVHSDPVFGGSNIWFVANMGVPDWLGGGKGIEPFLARTLGDGTPITNVYATVTMMITNTVTGEAWPPDRFNGHVYTESGSSDWNGSPAWTSAVFIVTGALQKPDVSGKYLPLQQYTFRPGSFGAADDPHPFQTRVEVVDPYSPNTMGDYYGWGQYRGIYNIFYRWIIKPRPEEYRVSPVPLTPNWTPSDTP